MCKPGLSDYFEQPILGGDCAVVKQDSFPSGPAISQLAPSYRCVCADWVRKSVSLLPPEIRGPLLPEIGGPQSSSGRVCLGGWDREMDLVLTLLKLRLFKPETN